MSTSGSDECRERKNCMPVSGYDLARGPHQETITGSEETSRKYSRGGKVGTHSSQEGGGHHSQGRGCVHETKRIEEKKTREHSGR